MGGTPLSMKQFAQSHADHALSRLASHPVGIEAPSIARCGAIHLEHACCLLVSDIVRRAIGILGSQPDFRVFIHDDGAELKKALHETRLRYLAAANGGELSKSNDLPSMAANRIWRSHGRRFLSKTSHQDWVPVFEQELCSRWIDMVDRVFKALGVVVSTWNTDAEILNETQLFEVFEERLIYQEMLRVDASGAAEVRTSHGSFPWRSSTDEPSTFARDVVYQALKLSKPGIEWKNFWSGATSPYIRGVVEVLGVFTPSASRLKWPLERDVTNPSSGGPALGLAESFDLGGLLESEGRSVTRLALLRVASGHSLTGSLTWAHEQVASLRSARRGASETDAPDAQDLCRTFLSSPAPLAWCLDVLDCASLSASFLTNASFIEDVLGVVIER